MKRPKNGFFFPLCYVAYMSIYIARLNLSTASPGLIQLGILDSAQIGLLGSTFSVVYASGRLITGILSDSRPPWVMISSGLLIAAVSNLTIGFFPPYIGMLLLWNTNAFAQSMLWSSILSVIAGTYDEQTARRKNSIMVTSVASGNILGILLNTAVITRFGLRYAFVIPGGLTLLCGLAVLLTMRNVRAAKSDEKKHIPLYHLLREREIRLALAPAVLHGMIKDNITLWVTVYFVSKFGIDLQGSAYFVLLVPVVGLFGRLLHPVCYQLCGEREHRLSIYAFLICAAAAIPLCFDPILPVAAAVCLGLIYAAVSIINTSLLSVFPVRFQATGNIASVSGVMDFAAYLGAGIGSLVYGVTIEHFGYLPMYASWAVISLISILFLYRLNRLTRAEAKIETEA